VEITLSATQNKMIAKNGKLYFKKSYLKYKVATVLGPCVCYCKEVTDPAKYIQEVPQVNRVLQFFIENYAQIFPTGNMDTSIKRSKSARFLQSIGVLKKEGRPPSQSFPRPVSQKELKYIHSIIMIK